MTMLALALALGFAPAEKDTRVFELRVYQAAKGKLDALNARFRDHTTKLFEKHGITNVGYFVPLDATDERLVYVLAHKSREAAAASWKAFGADPDWKKARDASEKDGRLTGRIDSVYLNATDYSPAVNPAKGAGDRAFELRTYFCPPKGLDALNARFQDHTTKLFEKHGMTNVAYWTLADDAVKCGKLGEAVSPPKGEKAEIGTTDAAKPVTLVYLLAHPSKEARDKAFDAFRSDPVWVKAKGESEAKFGGSLTVKDGVKSLMLKATDYSPMK